MTYPKIKPCPSCLDGGDPDLIEYDHGWKHVECFDCDLLGPGEGRNADAIRSWNGMVTAALASKPGGEGGDGE